MGGSQSQFSFHTINFFSNYVNVHAAAVFYIMFYFEKGLFLRRETRLGEEQQETTSYRNWSNIVFYHNNNQVS